MIYNIYLNYGIHKLFNNMYFFSLYCPKAKQVELIGEFSNWLPISMILDKTGTWSTVQSALEGQKYQYIIKTQDDQLYYKIDPFSFSIDNKYSIVFDIQSLCSTQEKLILQNNFYNMPLNIYEIYLGGWCTKYKTYREIAQPLIEYLKEYSFNAIEIMPIMEYPNDKTWGYQPIGFFSPTSRYGSPYDLMYLIDELHKNNIYVILDWIPAHFDPYEFGLINFDGQKMFEYPQADFETHPIWKTKCFNYKDEFVASFLISSANFWLDIYKIDGLRIDTVTTILQLVALNDNNTEITNIHSGEEEFEFVRLLTSILKQLHPNAILIAEETQGFKYVTEQNGLNFQYKQALGWAWDTGSWIFADSNNKQKQFINLIKPLEYHYDNISILIEGHDQIAKNNGFLIEQFNNSYELLKVFYSYYISFPGKKCIFMGNEYGQNGYWNFEIPLTFITNNSQEEFSVFVKNIHKFYNSNSALYEKDYVSEGISLVEINSNNQVLGFIRHSDNQNILCLFNFSNNDFSNYYINYNNQYTTTKKLFATIKYNFNFCLTNDGIICDLPSYSALFLQLY